MLSGMTWRVVLAVAGMALWPAPSQAGSDSVVTMLTSTQATPVTLQAKPAKRTAAADKAPAKKAAAARRARARLVAFTPPENEPQLIPPQTEQEAIERLEQDLALKVGKRRQADDYPEEAVRYRWSGTALVEVLVAGNGAIKSIVLGRTSGFKVLDDQALEMVRRVPRLWVPVRLRNRETNVSVPIGFQFQSL
jgi:TonB family protein